jgi:nucleotide-binding universal stress UspA family protein
VSSACILCPIDFSDSSRAALSYADALAEHFGARLILLSVDDPLLAEAASAGLASPLSDETLQELHRFSSSAIGNAASGAAQVARCVRTGKPAVEILREARASASDLIVMSSRGQTGIRKRFFGSTTERVLRETPVPVLITPTRQPPGPTLDDIAGHIGRIVAPVDLTAASERQLTIAAGIALALAVPLLVAHVVEPITISQRVRQQVTGADALRRNQAQQALDTLAGNIRKSVKFETMVLTGDPAEEIAKTAEARRANLIVMGLHSSPVTGPRMGSVTYRVLSLTRRLVLALPPAHTSRPA